MGHGLLAALGLLFGNVPSHGQQLAVVIDDLGASLSAGLQVTALPVPVTVAVLPFTPFATELATAAHRAGKQVIVHLPMQSLHGHHLGIHGLTTHLGRKDFQRRTREALSSVPFAQGANNHMGSLLTAHRQHMSWLMAVLSQRRGWMFLDSRTTPLTVAADSARQAGIPVVSRDVFLDNERSHYAIKRQLRRAADLALRRGHAVAIGHPHESTLAVLEAMLPRLQERGVELVEVARLARRLPAPGLIYTRYSPLDGQALRTR